MTTPTSNSQLREAIAEALSEYFCTGIKPGAELADTILTAISPLVEEMARDRERLDWLDDNMGKVIPGSGDAKYWIVGQKEFAPNKATNIRAAIDATRASSKGTA